MNALSVTSRWGVALGGLVAIGSAACSEASPNDPGNTGAMAGAAGTAAGSAGGGAAGSASGGAGGMPVAGSTAGGAGSAGTAGGGSGGAAGNAGAGGTAMGGCTVPPATEPQPMLLSATGCVDMADPGKPAPGFIPYSVRSPLWSDAAAKTRFVKIPDGAKIKVLDCTTQADACKTNTVNGDDGHWEMPVGTVLVKNFSLEGKIIETRLVMRRSMTKWLFYGYEWNEAATEATLLPDDNLGKDRQVGQQTWHYPGRGQCSQCHTPGAGFSLGPSTPQLDTDFPYADGMMNQVEKFKALGLFEAPPKAMSGYPDPSSTDVPLEQRARSYLQANCAICHRPSGEFSGMDLRWGTAFADTKLCDIVERDMGLVPKYRLVPGDTTKSTMSFRMHSLDAVRMPKIGSNVVDPQGTALIDQWISDMPADACPPQP
jgi:uncharacterized repeat protein (TIGR03806 family)